MSELKSKFDPVKEFVALRDTLTTAFSAAMNLRSGANTFPSVDIYYDANGDFVVRTQPLVNLDPKSLEVILENDTLTISGEILEPADENVNYLLQENPTGYFSRTIPLETEMPSENVEASVNKARVIHIRFPKE